MATEQTNANGVTYTNYQEDTPEAMKNEKRALLALMAEHGTEGQAEYQRSKEMAKKTRASSIEMAAARGAQVHAPGTLQASLEQNYDTVMRGLIDNTDQGMLGHGREMDRLAAANAAYLDQISGASQLNKDLLDKTISGAGGGGGGGGGRGGGGGGGGGYNESGTIVAGGPIMSLEEAGAVAGLGTPIGDAPSGTGMLFGDEQAQDGVGGDKRAKAILAEMQALAAGGAMSQDQLRERLVTALEATDMNTWQKDAAATTIHNYLGLGDPAQVGAYYSQATEVGEDGKPVGYGPEMTPEEMAAVNPYTTEGMAYNSDQENARFANRAESERGARRGSAERWLLANPDLTPLDVTTGTMRLPNGQIVQVGPEDMPSQIPTWVSDIFPETLRGVNPMKDKAPAQSANTLEAAVAAALAKQREDRQRQLEAQAASTPGAPNRGPVAGNLSPMQKMQAALAAAAAKAAQTRAAAARNKGRGGGGAANTRR